MSELWSWTYRTDSVRPMENGHVVVAVFAGNVSSFAVWPSTAVASEKVCGLYTEMVLFWEMSFKLVMVPLGVSVTREKGMTKKNKMQKITPARMKHDLQLAVILPTASSTSGALATAPNRDLLVRSIIYRSEGLTDGLSCERMTHSDVLRSRGAGGDEGNISAVCFIFVDTIEKSVNELRGHLCSNYCISVDKRKIYVESRLGQLHGLGCCGRKASFNLTVFSLI